MSDEYLLNGNRQAAKSGDPADHIRLAAGLERVGRLADAVDQLNNIPTGYIDYQTAKISVVRILYPSLDFFQGKNPAIRVNPKPKREYLNTGRQLADLAQFSDPAYITSAVFDLGSIHRAFELLGIDRKNAFQSLGIDPKEAENARRLYDMFQQERQVGIGEATRDLIEYPDEEAYNTNPNPPVTLYRAPTLIVPDGDRWEPVYSDYPDENERLKKENTFIITLPETNNFVKWSRETQDHTNRYVLRDPMTGFPREVGDETNSMESYQTVGLPIGEESRAKFWKRKTGFSVPDRWSGGQDGPFNFYAGNGPDFGDDRIGSLRPSR